MSEPPKRKTNDEARPLPAGDAGRGVSHDVENDDVGASESPGSRD